MITENATQIISEEMKVGDIVKRFPITSRVFEKYRIDFCCGGGITLLDNAVKLSIPMDDIIKDLTDIVNDNNDEKDWSKETDIEIVINHILINYHAKHKEQLPHLRLLMEKVNRVHSDKYSAITEALGCFDTISNEMREHMKKEEEVSFPAFLNVKSNKESTNRNIEELEDEHDTVGEKLKELRKITYDYDLPQWACNTFRSLFYGLEELEQDIHRHVHLENYVLHPLVKNVASSKKK